MLLGSGTGWNANAVNTDGVAGEIVPRSVIVTLPPAGVVLISSRSVVDPL